MELLLGEVSELTRQEFLCNDIHYNNAKVAELCGYPKAIKLLEKKFSVHNPKRKIGKRRLVRRNGNKLAHNV